MKIESPLLGLHTCLISMNLKVKGTKDSLRR